MRIWFSIVLFVLALGAIEAAAQNRTLYSSLSPKACRELKSVTENGAEYEGECPGVAGYKLRLLEGDLRQTIDIITPAKKRFGLDFWNITGAFNYVGQKAEWRLKGNTPVALIVRLTANQDPEDVNKTTSMLVVAKISRTGACVTDVIDPVAKQNEVARSLADKAQAKPCKYPKQ